jgi:AcrR family transcriptional regulator
MPRIAEARPAAEPISPSQKARQLRILQVARGLAAERGVEDVQMQDVARGAEVAVGTVYRYFPSKVHLFTAVAAEHVDRLATRVAGAASTGDPERDAFQILATSARDLLRRPVLAAGLLQSINSAHVNQVPDARRINDAFEDLLLSTLPAECRGEDGRTAVWLLIHCFYGLLTSCLNGRTTPDEVESDLRTAVHLLLVPLGDGVGTAGAPGR